MTTALACLLTAAALTGRGAGGGGAEKSAADLLDEANDTMRALRSVTVDMSNTPDDDRNGMAAMRLRTVYKGGGNVTTTSFSAFDEPLDVRPPASEQVVDEADVEG